MNNFQSKVQRGVEVRDDKQMTMIMSRWIPVSEMLPESGQEVLIYYYDEGYEIHQTYIVNYFCKGAVMDETVDYSIESPEERLLDSLFNPANQIKAPEDGFYVYESQWRKHANIITHWMPLPEPPKEVEEEVK